MTWQEVCENPVLQDLPFKIELNHFGQVVMSPASNEHGHRQSRIAAKLARLTEAGEPITECSVDTSDGTKVPDVAWCSSAFLKQHGFETPYQSAPEICVEVVSPSNSDAEMEMKKGLYFERGAKEVWICDISGKLSFFSPEGELPNSSLLPDFPEAV